MGPAAVDHGSSGSVEGPAPNGAQARMVPACTRNGVSSCNNVHMLLFLAKRTAALAQVDEAHAEHTATPTEPAQVGAARVWPPHCTHVRTLQDDYPAPSGYLSCHGMQEEATAAPDGAEAQGLSAKQQRELRVQRAHQQMSADPRLLPLAHACLDMLVFEEVETLGPRGALSAMTLWGASLWELPSADLS